MNIRKEYLDFFASKQHAIIPSASLLAENDPSLLFVNSGMFPLVPYFLGQKHPSGVRLSNSQKCFRAEDMEEVGDNYHTTFFEMLGNWSFNDYFKKEQLNWWFEFLIEKVKLDPSRLHQTVYQDDEETSKIISDIFRRYGTEKNVHFFGRENNWWQRGEAIGELGGTDSETFYDLQTTNHENCRPNCDCNRFLEIGNSVFMEYIMTKDGWQKIEQKNIDFGGGLERVTMVAEQKKNVFETSLFAPITKVISEKGEFNEKAWQVIADHVKASVFLLGDERGVPCSNTGQGYVIRRLLRRAIRFSRQIGMGSLLPLIDPVLEIYPVYPELSKNRDFVFGEIKKEEEKFSLMLERGLKEFQKMEKIDGASAFYLYQTHGFPIEMTKELADERGIEVDQNEFQQELEKHKNLSRTSSAGTFKGGLADKSEETTKLHSTTHLLLAALRHVLGSHVLQRGSNITAERLRFDFSHPEKLTPEQIQQIEDWVNDRIKQDLQMVREDMPSAEALQSGVVAMFAERYPDIVSVYSFVDKDNKFVSREICGGPHIQRTSELGRFKIIKEESPGSGMRRIKAVVLDE